MPPRQNPLANVSGDRIIGRADCAARSPMHEPPYTEEEEFGFYRRMNAGPKTIYALGPSLLNALEAGENAQRDG
jgi:hypothetical protein